MRLFKRFKKFDGNAARGDLLRRWDALNDKLYRQGVTDLRDKFSDMRAKIQTAEINSESYAALCEIIEKYDAMPYAALGVERLFGEMENIMCFKKKQPVYTPTQSSEESEIDEIQTEIDVTYYEIKSCQDEIAVLDKKIRYCLEHKLSVDWKIATNERRIKENILVSKQNALETLLKLKGNMTAARTTKEIGSLNETVTSAAARLDIEEMKETSENFHAVSEQIAEDGAEIDEIVFGQNAFSDDFDRAYEKYLAESVDCGSGESEGKEKKEV